jgi:hypothetical protein
MGRGEDLLEVRCDVFMELFIRVIAQFFPAELRSLDEGVKMDDPGFDMQVRKGSGHSC